MTKEEKLLNEACQRCENGSSSDNCEEMANCPVHQLYILATEKRKVKVVNRIIEKNTWDTPPTPRPEMILKKKTKN